ncbi:hypothetical protein [Alicyclobacillus fodiniaquatilis]|uniref:Sporulation protein Cse60 n=1 Tax=Alicyclobacillus fodiniaquatilis TaxID=1661150 RepID=A0ABW4JI46_9BACL
MENEFGRFLKAQVKLVSASSLEGLESETNRFLAEYQQNQIVSIEVAVSNPSSSVSTTYIATIVYRTAI